MIDYSEDLKKMKRYIIRDIDYILVLHRKSYLLSNPIITRHIVTSVPIDEIVSCLKGFSYKNFYITNACCVSPEMSTYGIYVDLEYDENREFNELLDTIDNAEPQE